MLKARKVWDIAREHMVTDGKSDAFIMESALFCYEFLIDMCAGIGEQTDAASVYADTLFWRTRMMGEPVYWDS